MAPEGKIKRTVWKIPTRPFSESHFASFPEGLCDIPIKAGCPELVCKVCGKPREKMYETNNPDGITGRRGKPMVSKGVVDTHNGMQRIEPGHNSTVFSSAKLVGLTDCGHNDYQPGIVLDPFCGSGTTGLVAKKLNRDFIGIDVKQEYIDMSRKRINGYEKKDWKAEREHKAL